MDAAYVLFPAGFVAMWLGALWLIAQIGGWTRLSEKFYCDNPPAGSGKGWQWGKIGSVNYKHCLWIAVDAKGLYLKTGPPFVFTAFHPPLLIPWYAIKSMSEYKYWWMRTFEITLNESDVKILIEQGALNDERRFFADKIKPLETESSN